MNKSHAWQLSDELLNLNMSLAQFDLRLMLSSVLCSDVHKKLALIFNKKNNMDDPVSLLSVLQLHWLQ
jgi:hypothetical protein